MLTRRTYWWCLWIAVALVLAAWAGFVGWISGPTLGWVTALVILLVGVSLLTMKAGQPTRSVAHVLYDTEQQKGAGR